MLQGLACRKSTLTSGQRLKRQGQARSAAGGRTKHRIGNPIVIGASAGGHQSFMGIFKELSVDMPAAIAIVLHMPRSSLPRLKKTMGRYCRLPIKEVV